MKPKRVLSAMWSVATKSAYILRCTSGYWLQTWTNSWKKKDKLPPYWISPLGLQHRLACKIHSSHVIKSKIVTIYSFPRNTGLRIQIFRSVKYTLVMWWSKMNKNNQFILMRHPCTKFAENTTCRSRNMVTNFKLRTDM